MLFCTPPLLSFYLSLDVQQATLAPGGGASTILFKLELPFRAENGTHWNCTGGAARFIDVTVFGEEHIYQHPTSIQVYGGVAHDPEGLLGTLNR